MFDIMLKDGKKNESNVNIVMINTKKNISKSIMNSDRLLQGKSPFKINFNTMDAGLSIVFNNQVKLYAHKSSFRTNVKISFLCSYYNIFIMLKTDILTC